MKPGPGMSRMQVEEMLGYLEECRGLALREIERIIPSDHGLRLYRLMLDYPLRDAKGLRPALSIATCRALGGKLDAVVPTAAVLELYHNAFLIHDDVEDGSLMRRGRPTLHREHGLPVAINVGDAMLSLSLQPLLDNMAVLGLGRALRILEAIARMTRESVEGQALELEWISSGAWELSDEDYIRMVEQKTGWYSFITPVLTGALVAGAPQEPIDGLTAFARALGIAFQIQDDVLNLGPEVGDYGKESCGDLWEGKRTLILLHAMRSASTDERAEAARILALPRPGAAASGDDGLEALGDELTRDGLLHPEGHARLRQALCAGPSRGRTKTVEDVRYLRALAERYGSLDYALGVARRWAEEAGRRFEVCRPQLLPSAHADFLAALVDYVLTRQR